MEEKSTKDETVTKPAQTNEKTSKRLILGRVMIVLAIVVVCLSVGLSVYFLTKKSETFEMKLVGSSGYVNVNDTLVVEVVRNDPNERESYELVSADESILKASKPEPSTDSNKIIWKFTALKGGKTEIKLSTENPNYNGKSFSIFVGSGDNANPYYIATARDLDLINKNSGSYFKQVSEIDLKGVDWNPIELNGNYDGNGQKISGLKLTNVENAGLFSSIASDSSVTNLKLTDFKISGATTAGALAGVNNGRVSLINVSNSEIQGTTAGGVVGSSVGSAPTETQSGTTTTRTWDTCVSGCGVENNVTLQGTTVGGIAGSGKMSFFGNNYSKANTPIVGELTDGQNAVIDSYAIQTTAIVGSYTKGDYLGGNYTNTTRQDTFTSYNGGSWNKVDIWDIPENNTDWPTIRPNAVLNRDGQVVTPSTSPSQLTIYTIIFNTNGGNSIGNIQINGGNSFATEGKELPIAVKRYYLFDGWYLDSDLTQPFTSEQEVKSNLVLYAKWAINYFNVNFVTNCDESFPSIKITKNGSFVSENESLPHPTKENATFIGWFIDEEQTTAFNMNTRLESDMFLYAGWEEEAENSVFVVTFNSNGGSAVSPMEITQGKSFSEDGYVLPSSTRSEYNFVGWYVDEQLTIAFTVNTKVESNLTLYAKWERASVYTDVDKLKRSFAADLADDGIYNNVYNISANIDFLGTTWTPIGTLSQPFNGEFNLVGEISNIKIVPAQNNRYVGFFGVIGNDGVVKGLNLRDVSVDLSNITNPVVGLIAGANLGKIENCYVENSAHSNITLNTTGYAVVGGIVGENRNFIQDCAVDTSINVNSENASVGGVVGTMVSGKVENVAFATAQENGAVIVVVTSKADRNDNVGGLVGEIQDGAILYSESNATITLTNENSSKLFVGGVVGEITDSATKQEKATVFGCEADGVNISGNVAGGLVGKVDIDNSEMFDVVSNSSASGKVDGKAKAAGLVGTMARGNMNHCITTCELSGDTVAGLAVDIERTSNSDIARVSNCLANITLGKYTTAYYSTKSAVFETNAGFGKVLEWLGVNFEKVAGYEENCAIVNNFNGRKQREFALGGDSGVDLNHLFDENQNEKLISESSAKSADTYKNLGFDEETWNIVDGEIPTLKK